MTDFDSLREARARLGAFCRRHFTSVMMFYAAPAPTFKIVVDEILEPGQAAHITTAATCIESLQQCPPAYQPKGAILLDQIAMEFALAAISREDWKSDGSAEIYCRCRGLPAVLAALPAVDFEAHEASVRRHIGMIWSQVKVKEGRFGIGEVTADEPYPPNCFHTYWALRTFSVLRRRFPNFWQEGMLRIEDAIPAVLMWTRQMLGWQIALHKAASSHQDSDQLAWAIATLLEFSEEPFTEKDIDAVAIALDCVFSTQAEYGGWPRFEPLFHYQKAGNAYCYTFETFDVLLGCALLPDREFFRRTLFGHREKLLRLLEYADRTAVPLKGEGGEVGWCSGHHPNRPKPEGWATASVFACAEQLRRLFGIWSKEAAEKDLGVRPSPLTQDLARTEIGNRGRVWLGEHEQPSRFLMTLFVNPVLLNQALNPDQIDPDTQLITERQARSAILFGPAGTSKTSLAAAVAGATGWKYLAIHASDFVQQGLGNVQARAEWIFSRLMELDHCVVLFDEIDELVRGREEGVDAFGRFLTTSMLPRIAELWKQGRIVYFVATNLLRVFDPAVTRSQRFDIRLFVAPPSFEAKIARLREVLGGGYEIDLTKNDVDKQLAEIEGALDAMEEKDEKLGEGHGLAKLVLARWDQVDELGSRLVSLESVVRERRIGREELTKALGMMTDKNLTTYQVFKEYFEQRSSIGRDFGRRPVWRLHFPGAVPREGELKRLGEVFKVDGEAQTWLQTIDLDPTAWQLPANFSCREVRPGELEIARV